MWSKDQYFEKGSENLINWFYFHIKNEAWGFKQQSSLQSIGEIYTSALKSAVA